ncbi:hypothetical protein FEM48_Zijuj01G0292000 [Ziziphus jujuba var. spinosa]|uniref:Peroxidase n=1 Tax=Ziziphus jujuba var. spinosa TaxID=714518 RepID=A0A978W5N6_ZIZJJ|nr:hypothetical protein FEM48_Zijuj01G0292000 [Ziziphus jujuba var. spinosa]
MGLIKEFLAMVSFMWVFGCSCASGLLEHQFYRNSCGAAEMIVKEEVKTSVLTDPSTAAALLRLAFHDCQVDGCDASILLGEPNSLPMELKSDKNFGIRKMGIIDMIKTSLEQHCPQTVSCADIIQLAAREAIYLSGGPYIQVLTGRRDSVSARAHTLGRTHCRNIIDRLQPRTDPTLSPVFSLLLKTVCSNPYLSDITFAQNDATVFVFDNRYFLDIQDGRGLLKIDSEVARDPRTRPYVVMFGRDMMRFFDLFTSGFLRLSSSKVLVGEEGEIRKDCRFRNK